jgi:NO-binding membrane sensor protein with MHYT domain
MQRAYASLTGQYDLRLVFVAGLICIAACLISMNLFIRDDDPERNRPLPWLFVVATVFGGGVWATHFITALAYEPGFPISYDAGLTALSFVAAIGAVWLGMFVAQRFAAPVLGGVMIGAGIAAMHYIGMAALRAPAQHHWDAGYVLASIAIAMTFAAAAMRVSSWGPDLPGRLMAAVLLVLAIVGLHFTAMAAVTLVPDPLIAVPVHAVAPTILALAIGTVMALIAALGLLGLLGERNELRRSHHAMAGESLGGEKILIGLPADARGTRQSGDFARGNRPADQIALHFRAAGRVQPCKLFFCLDAFRQRGNAEARSKIGDRLDNRHAIRARANRGNEGPVDLDLVYPFTS